MNNQFQCAMCMPKLACCLAGRIVTQMEMKSVHIIYVAVTWKAVIRLRFRYQNYHQTARRMPNDYEDHLHLDSLLLQQGSSNLFQSESKSVLSVRLLLLYIIGIPREGKDSLCWVADYLHEPMTFAPWNSSGAPL